MINVLFDTSVLKGGHAVRGIGTYARLLIAELEKIEGLKIFKSSTLPKDKKIKFNITHYPFFDLFFNTLPITSVKNKIVTIHDVIPLVFPDYYKPGIKGKLRFKKQVLALKRVSAVVTDSKSSKEDIIKYLGVDEDKVHVIYLAANPELKKQDEKMIRRVKRKYKLPKKYILYVGDINYNKNIPQLIKMMKYIDDKDVKLVCVGRNFKEQNIPEWQWIETQLALSDVADKVVFLNNVLIEPIDELAAIYTGAEVYVQPSLYEGFGLPVLEAMKCQVPVVSAQNSSLVEVGGENVLFAEAEGEGLAEKVNEILSWKKRERNKWVKDAFEWSESFSWKKTAEQTAELYKKILG